MKIRCIISHLLDNGIENDYSYNEDASFMTRDKNSYLHLIYMILFLNTNFGDPVFNMILNGVRQLYTLFYANHL